MHIHQLSELPFEGDIGRVQLLRTTRLEDWDGKEFKITSELLRTLKENFDKNVRKVALAVDYFHESDKEAAGWIKGVQLSNEDTELWINVEWTESAKQKITSKEIRYISADFSIDYYDEETKTKHGATLFGAGLTNRPRIKGMKAILSEKYGQIDFQEVLTILKGLSEDEKAQAIEAMGGVYQPQINFNDTIKGKVMTDTKILTESLDAAKVQLAEKEHTIQDLTKRLSEVQNELAKVKKTGEFNVLLSQGKVVESQRDAFMSNDIGAFLKNAVNLNLSEIGTGSDKKEEGITRESAQLKLHELAEKMSKEDGRPYEHTISTVMKNNPELAKVAGY